MCAAESEIYHSRLSPEQRTVLPRAVRQRLRISPGDRLRLLVDDRGVRIENTAGGADHEAFAAFSEWSSEVEEEAFAEL